MQNNNYLSLINFKVKFHHQRLFSNKHDVGCSNVLGCCKRGGARGVMVIVVGNGHGDTSSNPGPG